MPNYWDDTAKIYVTSVSPADLPSGTWTISPDVSAVLGVEPTKYWQGTTVVTAIDAAAKAVIDAADAATLVTENRAESVAVPDDVATDAGWRIRALIELLNKRDNFNTNRIIELQDRVQAMLDSTGGVANMRTDGLAVSISATATRAKPDAVQDYKDDINAGNQDT